MADDGLLLNFTGGELTVPVKPSYKGGHWKERLHVKRLAQRNRQRPTKPALRRKEGGWQQSTPPPKKIKFSEDEPDSQNRSTISRPSNVGPQREVISSLFTFNPAPKTALQPRKESDTTVAPSNAPLVDGIDTFTSLGLSPVLATHLLAKMNLKAPTAIQKSTISQLVSDDSDAFIQAETGSGKTLAYLLPIVHRIMEISKDQRATTKDDDPGAVHRDSGLFAIVLAPTRELSKQISVVLESLLRCANWIVPGTVIGGEKKKSEKARLRKGLNILVATPGRLVDHLSNTEVLDVSNVRWLVLDEGDRLMELGFESDIRTILSQLKQRTQKRRTPFKGLPERRTTVLCSATMKTNVERLGELSLEDAVHIKADSKNNEDADGVSSNQFSAPAQLKQSYIVVVPKQRLVTLAALLRRTFARRGSVMKAIVFVSCADSVEFHFALFTRPRSDAESPAGVAAKDSSRFASTTSAPAAQVSSPGNRGLTLHKLHGSMAQPVRTSTLKTFSGSSDPSILICTDVASRGLDLPSIDLVVEYDPAFSAEDHLHRIGRTARAGRDGRATIFLMPGSEESYVDVLKKGFKEGTGTNVTQIDTNEILKRGFAPETDSSTTLKTAKQNKNVARAWEDAATEFQLDTERWIVEDSKASEIARKAYISHVRAYATHTTTERFMFDVKSLHLGHLAKAFALRDKPGNMGRGQTSGKRLTTRRDGQRNRKSDGRTNDGNDENGSHPQRDVDRDEAAKKMRKAMKSHMSLATEFNIG
ncbi:MAG: ATP-dependent RNA helicase dbp7 [Stictis urceolatum]|nr:ATP-dependent RNA helicase dbp7 [Stictis urceolata]